MVPGNDENIIIAMHIFSQTSSADDFGTDNLPMTVNVLSVITAFNNRSTITINGNSYDYSDATGKVRCILTGHTHYDKIYTATDNLPVICITDATDYMRSPIKFDLGFLDYENDELHLIRVNDLDGAGTRVVTLR